MRDRLIRLRAIIEVQAETALAQIDAALAELADEEAGLRCPHCGEKNEDSLPETTAMGEATRHTCLTCANSFDAKEMRLHG